MELTKPPTPSEDLTLSCYKSLQHATRTALEYQKVDLDPEIREVKAGIRRVFGELEHLLSAVTFIHKRDVEMAAISAKPPPNSFQGTEIYGVNNVIMVCLKNFKKFAQEQRDMNLELELTRLIDGFIKVKDELQSTPEQVKFQGKEMTDEQYNAEKTKNFDYIKHVYKKLPNTIWEMWSWKLEAYDRGYLYNSVTRKTLDRHLTGRVKG